MRKNINFFFDSKWKRAGTYCAHPNSTININSINFSHFFMFYDDFGKTILCSSSQHNEQLFNEAATTVSQRCSDVSSDPAGCF